MSKCAIPFNQPYLTGNEIAYIQQALKEKHLKGNGYFTHQCQKLLSQLFNKNDVLLTHSCTAALEMAALLANIQPGDEVIMPSYTFVSTANAFVLRGATPVFVDIRPDTLNIDESKIEAAITDRTKAIVPVHYAGVSCDMDSIMATAQEFNLIVIEDAAQAIMSSAAGSPVGTRGDLAAVSFHETKNIQCGEGGALIINNQKFLERAEIIREKGTNRKQFIQRKVDKYTWCDVGSSYIPSDLNAAFLLAQLENAQHITNKRLKIWSQYNELLSPYASVIPIECQHNAHMFYMLLQSPIQRDAYIRFMQRHNVSCSFHYTPLHQSHMAKGYLLPSSELKYTEKMSNNIVRLPLWPGMTEEMVSFVAEVTLKFFDANYAI
ncbi:dTDP-4-amino-4,6-dideoxygalactose transaminase [Planctobacterium marinum]|uniref:dTDP-4-amino-4,6-dideoxygalactose transaminase n=1 Tax=Planctobacterium marinum TaxID=1631968 RepID=UPI001E5E5169|nr:dTDP-4-amino-4,6-dideoxygalactose transaminase [Planctobacterium marinum]MCC2606124.1 dTDP-4-amino-4,6-dideoxygalactose transaminase [Planctobacterium marinum]